MPLMRILVDGYSLLHNWTDLAPGKPRHSEAARDELIQRLTQYQDAIGTPVTIIFDGNGAAPRAKRNGAKKGIEVIYSPAGRTADDLIERAAHRFAEYGGEIMAVTDDNAERETVLSLGGMASSCDNFVREVEDALAELKDNIKYHNRKERHKFQRRR